MDIFKLAKRLEVFVYRITEKFPFDEKYRSVDQLRRSSSSVVNNISESYFRYSYNDKINRMYIARGEAGETKHGICSAFEKGLISDKLSLFTQEKYVELLKGINGYIRYLNKQKIIKNNRLQTHEGP